MSASPVILALPGGGYGMGSDRASAAGLSLERLVTPAAPPMFLWHTSDDPAVPVRRSYLLAQALAESRVPHELHVFATGSGRHGLGLAEGTGAPAAWTDLWAEWLRTVAPVPHTPPPRETALSTEGNR